VHSRFGPGLSESYLFCCKRLKTGVMRLINPRGSVRDSVDMHVCPDRLRRKYLPGNGPMESWVPAFTSHLLAVRECKCVELNFDNQRIVWNFAMRSSA
jgi:hypothetical protein